MARSTRNSGKPWTSSEVRELRRLARGNTPTGVMSVKLGRTKNAIYTRASEEGISLKPTNQSPYNRRRK